MGKSQETYNKKEREKKKAKRRKLKAERREQRKLEKAEKGKLKLEDQFMYLDHDGNLVKEKPDPNKKNVVKASDIRLGVPENSKDPVQVVRRGKVKYFDDQKGYGFITDKATKESVFVHMNDAYDNIKENHIVEFELGKGPKGNKAIRVKHIS